jgi:hypothetical protein
MATCAVGEGNVVAQQICHTPDMRLDESKIFSELRIPLKTASDSEANRPPLWSKAARGSERSDAGVFVIA